MRKLISSLLFVLVLVFSFVPDANSKGKDYRMEWKGVVVGHHGTPLSIAHVLIRRHMGWERLRRVRVKANGSFRLVVNAKGLVLLQVIGLHHKSEYYSFYIHRAETIKLRVQLAPKRFHDKLDKYRLIGEFNKFSRYGGKPIKCNPKGVCSIVIPSKSKTFAYQIFGATSFQKGYYGGQVAGTSSIRNYYKKRKGYISTVPVKNGKATIVFERRKLPFSKTNSWMKIVASSPLTRLLLAEMKRYKATNDIIRKTGKKFSKARMLFYRKLRKSKAKKRSRFKGTYKQFGFDVGKHALALSKRLEKEKQPLLRKVMLIHYFRLMSMGLRKKDKRWVEALCALAEKGDSLFSRPPAAYIFSSFMFGYFSRGICIPKPEKVFASMIDPYLHAYLLSSIASRLDHLSKSKSKAVRKSMARFKSKYVYAARLQTMYVASRKVEKNQHLGKSIQRYIKEMNRRFGRNRSIQVGKVVPAFSVPALGKGKSYSSKNIRGHYVLIQFWTLWCGNCITELPHLQKLHQKYRNKKFRILSIALEQYPKPVLAFQKKRWPMPWWNAIAKKEFSSKVAKTFEVTGVPTMVLLDPKGKIVAAGASLRGKKLLQTLEKILPKDKK